MLTPSKHEDISKSLIVVGSEIIKIIKKYKTKELEEVFNELNKDKENNISLNHYYNTLTFLWLIDSIVINNSSISLKR